MASGADTGDGIIPTLALVDELHRHPSGELYGVFRFKIVKRQGQMVTISTAGAAEASPLGQLRRAAYELPIFQRHEAAKHTVARSADGAFVMHEWCLADSDDPHDMALVAKANPASWKTKTELRSLASSPSMTPWEWLRFACGVWTEGEEPAIDPSTWDALGDLTLEIADGSEVWVGVDIGTFGEPSAIAIIRSDQGEIWAKVQLLDPIGNTRVPLQRVEATLRELSDRFQVRAIAYDSRSFQRSADMLEADGLPMVEFPQSEERLMLASGTFFKLVEEGRLHHDGDPALRAHVLGARVKDTERGWRFRKDSSNRPTDALFALAVACHVALTQPPDAIPAFFSLGG
jgi:phage terminase large subunit-like protein